MPSYWNRKIDTVYKLSEMQNVNISDLDGVDEGGGGRTKSQRLAIIT